MKYQFYAADWAPNGTNDLIVADRYGKVVECIPEALFGVNVDAFKSRHPLVVDNTQVYRLHSPASFVHEIHTPLKRMSIRALRRSIACSPVDPNGTGILFKLNKYLRGNK